MLIYTEVMADRLQKGNITEHGKRLAEFRRAAGLTQVEVAKALGIPQRTVSYYEREARQLPQSLAIPLSKLLGVTPEVVLGLKDPEPLKRGPKSRLERLFERAQQLPRTQQDFIAQLLTKILAAEGA